MQQLIVKAGRVRIDADADPLERGAVVIETGRLREIDQETGALRPGLAADLVATDGDPVEEILAVWNVRLIVARGQAVEYASGPRLLATS